MAKNIAKPGLTIRDVVTAGFNALNGLNIFFNFYQMVKFYTKQSKRNEFGTHYWI
jgi:hypothetical protein